MEHKIHETNCAPQYPRWHFFLAPGATKESIAILREAFRKTFQDPEFHKHFKKMIRVEASPLNGKEVEKGIAAISRDPEVLTLFKALAGPGPIPAR